MTITINIAADREDRPALPYIWWDDTPGMPPGWVVRYCEAGIEMDQGLDAADRADEAGAIAEATAHLTSVHGNATAIAERVGITREDYRRLLAAVYLATAGATHYHEAEDGYGGQPAIIRVGDLAMPAVSSLNYSVRDVAAALRDLGWEQHGPAARGLWYQREARELSEALTLVRARQAEQDAVGQAEVLADWERELLAR